MPSSRSLSYAIIEPHPTVTPSKSYIHSGRGGAGNVTKAPSEVTVGPSASGPAARASIASLSKPRTSYLSGRGGAGNLHANSSERAIFSFDEELERQMIQESNVAPVYHVGRGGAGNVLSLRKSSASSTVRRDSDSSARSNSSVESGADVATRKLRQGFKRMTGAF